MTSCVDSIRVASSHEPQSVQTSFVCSALCGANVSIAWLRVKKTATEQLNDLIDCRCVGVLTKSCIRTFVSAIVVVVVVVAVVVVVVVIGRRRGYRMSLGRRRRRRRRRRCRRVDALARKEIVTFERRPPTGAPEWVLAKSFVIMQYTGDTQDPEGIPEAPGFRANYLLPGKLLAPGRTTCSQSRIPGSNKSCRDLDQSNGVCRKHWRTVVCRVILGMPGCSQRWCWVC